MSARRILFLHGDAASDASLSAVVEATRALGAEVVLRALDRRYDEILDEISRADVCVYWRAPRAER